MPVASDAAFGASSGRALLCKNKVDGMDAWIMYLADHCLVDFSDLICGTIALLRRLRSSCSSAPGCPVYERHLKVGPRG